MPAIEAIRLPAGDPAVDEEIDALLARCPTSFAQQTRGWRDVIAANKCQILIFNGFFSILYPKGHFYRFFFRF